MQDLEVHEQLTEAEAYIKRQQNAIDRYEKALFALLDLSYEYDDDLYVDIITDTLGGYELMEQYEEYASRGKKEFNEHFHKEDI